MSDKDNELWYAVQDIVKKHTKQSWKTPYHCENYIPSSEIYSLKQDIFNLCKDLQKRNAKGKM